VFLGCLFSVIWVLLDLNPWWSETDLCCYGNLERPLLMSVDNISMFHVIGDSYSSKLLSICPIFIVFDVLHCCITDKYCCMSLLVGLLFNCYDVVGSVGNIHPPCISTANVQEGVILHCNTFCFASARCGYL
jgi:hypothetical protein